MSKIVIYHDRCTDGMASAWVLRRKYPDAIFYPGRHGENPPPVTSNDDVILVDFSYSKTKEATARELLLGLKQQARSILILDHHDSALKELGDLDFFVFDINKSGAGLAWDYYFPDESRPFFISYIEDRDLWRFALPNSEEINAAFSSYPRSFATFDTFYQNSKPPELHLMLNNLISEGVGVLRYKNQLVENLAQSAREVEFQGYKILVANTACLQSELGSKLAENRPFSLTWFKDENGQYIYSLRSKEMNIIPIAKKYDGGGHPNASGFRLDYLLF